MGKQQKNKLQQANIIEDQATTEVSQLQHHQIRSSALKKIISNKNKRKETMNKKKHQSFKQSLACGRYSEIISPKYFECSICLQTLVSPVMMLCGHLYCLRCLQSSNTYSNKCCLCRQDQHLEPYISSVAVEKIIDRFIIPRSDDFVNYFIRKSDSESWLKRRKLNILKEGQIVDFYDRWGSWHQSIAHSVFKKDGVLMLKIRSEIKGFKIFDIVEANSQRVAPSGFFTKKKYLQEFSQPRSLELNSHKQVNESPKLIECKDIQIQVSLGNERILQNEVGMLQKEDENIEQNLRLFNFQMDQHSMIF